MRTIIYSFAILLLAPVGFLAFKSLTSPAPKTGLADNRLRPCPGSPNCVVSENDTPASRIEALRYTTTPERAWTALREAIERNGGTIREDHDGYLWATFTSRIFRFVDDAEFRMDAGQGLIHARSASRAGYSDLGVNRRRVERLRAAFADALQ